MTEILSPVGNREMLIAAVRSGADAVYLGAREFNARRNADNFTSAELTDVCEYCHLRGVKVYLTLNTYLYDNEMNEALTVGISAAKSGIDGIICTDLGLAKLLRKKLPEVPLHASTQLTVHTADALPALKELGFCRVVPSREMSCRELKVFCEKANILGIEVEVFLHGALCMSMSGGCLMSAVFGARSGNRGLCAGPCRLPFASGKNGYALSLKDMSYIGHIEELKNIGVTSFKIEGRMKTPEYVAAATYTARKTLDTGVVDLQLSGMLESVFSRSGFTDGYFTENYSKEMFGIRTEEDKGKFSEVSGKIHDIYRRERQAVGINARLSGSVGEKAQLYVTDGKTGVEVIGDILEKAEKIRTDDSRIEGALGKLGGTPYYLKSCEVLLRPDAFLPLSAIGEMRRNALERLGELRTKTTPVKISDGIITETQTKPNRKIIPEKQKFIIKTRNLDTLPKNSQVADYIIIPAEKWQEKDYPAEVLLEFPRAMSDERLIQKCLENTEKSGCTAIAQNLSAINLLKNRGLPFIAGEFLNILNSDTASVYEDLGADGIIAPYEMKLSGIKKILPTYVTVYGKTPLMLTRVCPVKVNVGCAECTHKITDRKGIDFPVYCRGGYSEIFNSRPTVLSDRLPEFSDFDGIILSFCDETQDQAERIIDAYLIGEKPTGEYTRGLYYKGVL